MKIKYLLGAAAAAVMVATSGLTEAQTTVKTVVVSRIEGEAVTKALSQVGKITLGETNATLVPKEGEEIDLGPISNISKISFGEGEMTASPAKPTAVSVSVGPNPATDALTISGIGAGADIAVIDRGGKTVLREKAEAEVVTISVASLPEGVYVLVAGGEAFKIVKK